MGWRSIVLLALLPAAGAVAQEPVEEPPTTLGQPAGWSLEPSDATTLIKIAANSVLYLRPDRAAERLAVLSEGRLPLLESRDEWVKVRYGQEVGWVDLEAPPEESATPVRRFIRPPPAAREILPITERWHLGELGPLALFSEVQDRGVLDNLGRVAAGHAVLYAERYGLMPEAPVAGDFAFFATRRSFDDFRHSQSHTGPAQQHVETQGFGYFRSPDLVVIYRGGASRQQLAATLLHEMTHLVTWHVLGGGRFIGGALPPWLEEGMAVDLSLATVGAKGRLRAAPLDPLNLQYRSGLWLFIIQVERQIDRLPGMMELDSDAFLAGDAHIRYLLSALFIRYLLDSGEPALAEGFRGFLGALAEGEGAAPEILWRRLGRDWSGLRDDFLGWLIRTRRRLQP